MISGTVIDIEILRFGQPCIILKRLIIESDKLVLIRVIAKVYLLFVTLLLIGGGVCASNSTGYLAPVALAATGDGQTLFIACANARHVLYWDVAGRKTIHTVSLSQPPTGLALSRDTTRLYVTCAAPESQVCVIDVVRHKIIETFFTGHTAQAPVLSPDGKALYVCNQFDNDVSVIYLGSALAGGSNGFGSERTSPHVETGRRVASSKSGDVSPHSKNGPAWPTIPVQREPVAADITPDGKYLLVANQLPVGRSDVDDVAAVVSVIDTAAGLVVKELRLPSGSETLKDLKVSPDGKYAAVTHLFASFQRATAQVRQGWMNANALTLIDLNAMNVRYTLLLDEPERGAANPWGLAWSADGQTLAVAHAGTHEVSLINFPALLAGLPPVAGSGDSTYSTNVVRRPGDLSGRSLGKTGWKPVPPSRSPGSVKNSPPPVLTYLSQGG
jgi:DNA-binding beta-propeller fold protein YncE